MFPRMMVMVLGPILDMEILYPESTGNHVPFRIGVSIERIHTLDESSSKSANRLDWSRLSKSDIDSYTLLTDDILSKVHVYQLLP